MVLEHLKVAAEAFAEGLARRAVAFAAVPDVKKPTPPQPTVKQRQVPTVAQTMPSQPGENTSDFMEWWKEQEILREFHPNSPHIDEDFDRMQVDSVPPIHGVEL